MGLARQRFLAFLALISLVLIACEPGGELGAPPAVLQASAVTGDGRVTVSWQATEGVERYRVYVLPRADADGRSNEYELNNTSLDLGGLENGREYEIRVTAVDETGEGPAQVFYVIPQPIPAAPQNVEVAASSETATLSWQEASNVDGYNIYVVPLDEWQADSDVRLAPRLITDSAVSSPHTVRDLENGTEYVFLVTAFNSSGESDLSTWIAAVPGAFHSLMAGNDHTCVFDATNALWCWGNNSGGQIGSLIASSTAKPVKFADNVKWRLAALGWGRTCAVSRSDSLECWGAGSSGSVVIAVDAVPHTSEGAGGSVEQGSGATWRQLSAALNSACGTYSDGSLWCWGLGDSLASAQLRRIDFSLDWREVSNGDAHQCAIKMDGSLWCWGENFIGQLGDGTRSSRRLPNAVEPAQKWTVVTTSVGVGQSTRYAPPPGIVPPVLVGMGTLGHTCAISNDAHLFCWGFNARGQLGSGTYNESLAPQEVSGGGAWRAVDAGTEHTCGIQVDGSLWCWGSNQVGQLGVESNADQVRPLRVSDDTTWTAVATGEAHTCASRRDGSIWCTGSNMSGQIGISRLPYQVEPHKVVSNVATVVATELATCVIRHDVSLWCWGMLGTRVERRPLLGAEIEFPHPDTRPVPVRIELPADVELASLSIYFDGAGVSSPMALCLLDQDGVIWCQDSTGSDPDAATFSQVAGDKRWNRLVLGDRYSCGIQQSGGLFCWGGDLSVGYPGFGRINGYQPQPMSSSLTWADVAVGRAHACATNAEFELWCWGQNFKGQLAFDPYTVSDAATPRRALPEYAWRTVTAGYDHTCALTRDDSLWCWGSNESGQLGVNADVLYTSLPQQVGALNEWSYVNAGGATTCAIKRDTSLWCWGVTGEAGRFTHLLTRVGNETGWTSVVTRSAQTCATKANGDLYCWGENWFGQVGDGSAWVNSWHRVSFEGS